MYLIDTHVHIGRSTKFSRYWEAEDYLSLMSKLGIERSVVIPNLVDDLSISDVNELFYEEITNFRFIPFFMLDIDNKNAQQLHNYRQSIKGIKYHPSFSRVTVDCLDLQSIPNLPLLIHCGRDSLSRVDYVIKAAKENKDRKFIAAHMAGMVPDLIEEALRKIRSSGCENIWIDISAVNLPCMIVYAVEILGDEKIFFGSDEPYQDVMIAKATLEYAKIKTISKERIGFENAKLFFDV